MFLVTNKNMGLCLCMFESWIIFSERIEKRKNHIIQYLRIAIVLLLGEKKWNKIQKTAAVVSSFKQWESNKTWHK